jgi:hypothetical protein
VFGACVEHGVAVEINCRPERMDPPDRLLGLAAEAGCRFAIDTDAHAPGQLEWQLRGCERAAACDVSAEMVINTMPADDLVEGMSQRSNIQTPRKPEGHGDIVTCAFRIQALKKPEALLTKGEGDPLIGRQPGDPHVSRRTGSPPGEDPLQERPSGRRQLRTTGCGVH